MEGLAHRPHLHADVVDGGVDARFPIVEHLGGVLHVDEPIRQLLLHRRDAIRERNLQTRDVPVNALDLVIHVAAEGLQLVQNQLEIGFHGSQISAKTDEVVVVDGVGFQIVKVESSSTDQINLGLEFFFFLN